MREDTLKLIEEAQTAVRGALRLLAEEPWAERDVYDGYKQGIRTANMNAALEALGHARVSEATAPDESRRAEPDPPHPHA